MPQEFRLRFRVKFDNGERVLVIKISKEESEYMYVKIVHKLSESITRMVNNYKYKGFEIDRDLERIKISEGESYFILNASMTNVQTLDKMLFYAKKAFSMQNTDIFVRSNDIVSVTTSSGTTIVDGVATKFANKKILLKDKRHYIKYSGNHLVIKTNDVKFKITPIPRNIKETFERFKAEYKQNLLKKCTQNEM